MRDTPWRSRHRPRVLYVEITSSRAAATNHWQTAPAYAVPTQACPANDGQTFTDSLGVTYQLRCYSDTSGGSIYGTGDNVYSFNDCAYICSSNQGLTAPTTCGGLTYVGTPGTNGIGGGTCYIKPGPDVTFNVNGETQMIALIRVAAPLPLTTTTTTTTSTTSTVSPNAKGVAFCNSTPKGRTWAFFGHI